MLPSLAGKNIVVYDTEIKMAIGQGGFGWKDFDKLGISCACLFDYKDGEYKVYLSGDYHRLAARLNSADFVVGFNIFGFDNPLLRGAGYALNPDQTWDGTNGPGLYEGLNTLDLLYLARLGCGWDGKSDCFIKGLKLDNILEHTYGREIMKTADGAQAPYMYQRGDMGQLITYCLGDVRREKMVFEDAVKGRGFKGLGHPNFNIAIPEKVRADLLL